MGIFSKPKLWDELGDLDKDWAKKLTKANAGQHLIFAAGTGSNGTRLRFILANMQIEKDVMQKAALAAIETGQTHHLKFILANVHLGKFLSDRYVSSADFLETMLQAAARNKNLPAWEAVQEICSFQWKHFGSVFDAHHYLLIAAERNWHEAAAPLFDKIKNADGSYYGSVLKQFCAHKDEDILFALKWIDNFNGKASNLARCLQAVAAKGECSKAEILFKAGANPHANSALALQSAVEAGHIDMIDLFIKHGMRLNIFGQEILDNLSDKQGTAGWAYFKQRVAEYQPAASVVENDSYSLAAIDTLSQRQTLPGGGSLTILFNFTLRQQMVLTDKVNAVVSFDDIHQDTLAAAREKLIAKGGVAPEVASLDFARPAVVKRQGL